MVELSFNTFSIALPSASSCCSLSYADITNIDLRIGRTTDAAENSLTRVFEADLQTISFDVDSENIRVESGRVIVSVNPNDLCPAVVWDEGDKIGFQLRFRYDLPAGYLFDELGSSDPYFLWSSWSGIDYLDLPSESYFVDNTLGELSYSMIQELTISVKMVRWLKKSCSSYILPDSIANFPDPDHTIKLKQEITLYPNPAYNTLAIGGLDANWSGVVRILSMDSRLVRNLNWKNQAPEKEIDVANLSPGMYFLVMEEGQKSTTKRFMKLP